MIIRNCSINHNNSSNTTNNSTFGHTFALYLHFYIACCVVYVSESFRKVEDLEAGRRLLNTDVDFIFLLFVFSPQYCHCSRVDSYLSGIGGKINQSNGLEKVIIICDKRRMPASLMSHRPQTLLLTQSISELLDTPPCGKRKQYINFVDTPAPVENHSGCDVRATSSPACNFLLLCEVL